MFPLKLADSLTMAFETEFINNCNNITAYVHLAELSLLKKDLWELSRSIA